MKAVNTPTMAAVATIPVITAPGIRISIPLCLIEGANSAYVLQTELNIGVRHSPQTFPDSDTKLGYKALKQAFPPVTRRTPFSKEINLTDMPPIRFAHLLVPVIAAGALFAPAMAGRQEQKHDTIYLQTKVGSFKILG